MAWRFTGRIPHEKFGESDRRANACQGSRMNSSDLAHLVRTAPPANRPALLALRTARMGRVLAIDPGCTQSAFVIYDGSNRKIHRFGKQDNADVLQLVRDQAGMNTWDATEHLAVEMIASYGMPVGREIFETVLWIGRFIEAWGGERYTKVYRKEVKLHLCGSIRANDSNIRQALIDKFGHEKAVAIGTAKKPGPLHGISKDVWAALAVGVYWSEGM